MLYCDVIVSPYKGWSKLFDAIPFVGSTYGGTKVYLSNSKWYFDWVFVILKIGGVGFHWNAFSPKRLFTERPFHQKGSYSSLGLCTE